MRPRIVALALAVCAVGCSSLDNKPGVRRTHEDRWRAATAAYERDLARRGGEPTEAAAAVPDAAAPSSR